VVGRVDPGSLAETMGVKAGDLVKSVNGQAVGSFAEIRMQLAQLRAGDEVKLSIEREGATHNLTGTITRPAKRTVGRVEAKRAGNVTVEVHDVTKFSVWVSPGMLNDKGELTVRLNNQTLFAGKVETDPAVLLDEFVRSGEREGRYMHRIQIDVKQPKRR
jgi:membrane-associated protease RseP (regulator of RpoE activity)